MNNQKILEFISKYKEHKFYQPVVFKSGILEITGKWHNTTIEFAQQLFKDNKVERLLDVGCNVGFFLHEAKKIGISRVVGYEIDPYVLEIAHELNQIFQDGSIIESIDLTKRTVDETFDLTLLLNLTVPIEQHCNIIKNTHSRKFILEVPSNAEKEFSEHGIQLSNIVPSQRVDKRTIIAEVCF